MRQPLRQQLIAERNKIEPAARMAAAESVAADILHRLPTSGGYLAGYWATAGELPLHILQLRLPSEWVWCLPVVRPERQLLFAPWRSGDPLASNRYGIPEPEIELGSCLSPEAMTVVLLPLLAFTRQGQRLGMGGGYYDSSFAFRKQRPAPPRLIGIGYTCQEIAGLDNQSWDVPLDAVATECGWIDCRQQGSL